MFDFIEIMFPWILVAVTVTRLFIVHSIALTPYTTKCSPKSITFPGAEAFDFK
jgi:hypothetical protein